MQKSACQRGRFSVNTSLLLTNASRKRKPNGAAGHRKQSRTSPRQTENLASQHRLQLRVEGFPSGQREQTVNLSSMTSVVRIHPLPPEKKSNHFGYSFLYFIENSFVGGFEPHTINATACVSSELSNPPSSTGKKSDRFDYSFFIIKSIFIAIFNDILLPFDIAIQFKTFYNLNRNKFESDDENADIHLCFTRKI